MQIFKKLKRAIEQDRESTTNNRKKVGILLFTTSIGLFFLFAVRLSYIVMVGNVAGESLESRTKELYQGSTIVKAKRGAIYDRNGLIIAEDATSFSLNAILDKKYVSGETKLYAQEKDFDTLATILSKVSKERFKKKVVLETLNYGLENDKYQVAIVNGRSLTLKEKQAIEEAMKQAGVKGLYFDEHPARFYPNGVFSSHLIGYADVITEEGSLNEKLEGKTGLEAIFDDKLSGEDGVVVFQKDNYGNPLAGTVAESKPAVDGMDVYTTINSRIQSYLEKLVDEAFEKSEPEYISAVLMKAKTGEIVALSQRPSYDPQTKEGLTDFWQNILVEEPYEPGSTMKILTVAAAIDEGKFNENETFKPGRMKLIDAWIQDWDYGIGSKPSLTMRQALSWSSNVGMVILQQRFPDRWQRYLKEFGFGQSTYSGLYGEHKGVLPEDNLFSQANSAFGQGILVTQMQMLQAFTAISNDGAMLKPYFIKKTVDPKTGKEVITQPEVIGHPISAESARLVREYMRDTNESSEYGTAYDLYHVENYPISVKTGTAQIAEGSQGYLTGENDNIYSVVTMLPTDDPEYVFYVTLKKPKKYDSSIIPGIANPLLKRAMELENVDEENDNEAISSKVTVEDYRNLGTTTAANEVQKSGLSAIVLGDGKKIVAQSIRNGDRVMPGEKLILLTNSKNRYMPDVSGWSKADLIRLADLLDMEISFEGEGYAVSQSIASSEIVTGKKLHFKLEEN